MNNVSLLGRLTSDPQVKYNGELCIAKYTIAVDRIFKRDGENGADFIKCVAFGKKGEFAEKYLYKGIKIGVTGRIQTGSYENESGNTVYTFDVIIDTQEFAEKKPTTQSAPSPQPKEEIGNEFMDVNEHTNLPFV